MKTFDKFADWIADHVAKAGFFTFCLVLVIVWLPSILVMPKEVPPQIDTWQLVINTATTIITFLLVALLHNTNHRFEAATNKRLQEIIDKLDEAVDPVDDPGQKQ